MAEVSATTLTFLFTDLEGSTRLWEEHPTAMRTALAHHDGLVRAAVEGHGGQVVKSTGDGALATFRTAHDGVGAAIDAQGALCSATWPDELALRVRMGLHTGEATERDGDWFGSDVNRAARVMAAAHGGQILCTGAIGEQVREQVGLVDLGEHRLRDLQSAVHLFQVEGPGLPATFPPVRSLDAYRSNLPYELSTFVGRADEMRSIADRMSSARVVSIVGVGGVGKTRLALQVGSELLPRYADGVWLCELAEVLDPDDLPGAVAAAVDYTPPQGVPVDEGLPRFLERKELLLVLDNCEHLLGAVSAFVSATTAHAAHVSILATSREALGVRGEHISPLASLDVPEATDAVSVLASDAGALFVARASEARGDLALDDSSALAVHDLCLRLDGIPLALELAAAQTRFMTPGEILTRLDKQFRLLTGGRGTSLERHQTLRAAIDWSYDLLADDERALLDRLSVCVAGFDLDAVVAIAAGTGTDEFEAFELLASLVAKSLVERNEQEGATRYRLLEMIRQYAAEQLGASGAAEAARDDHARHYLALAVALYGELSTTADYQALHRLDAETANVAAGGRWLLAAERLADLVQFFDAVPFFDVYAAPATTLQEIGGIAAELVEHTDLATRPGYASACWIAATPAYLFGDLARFAHLTDLARDVPGEPRATTFVLDAMSATFDGDLERAASSMHRAVERARHEGEPAQLAWILAVLAMAETLRDSDGAAPIAEEALALARRQGGMIVRLHPLKAVMGASTGSDPARVLEAADEATRVDRTERQECSMLGQMLVARLQVARGEITAGLAEWRKILHSYDRNGQRTTFSLSLMGLAGALAASDPLVAVEISAISESDAIAPAPAFATRDVAPLLEDLATEVDDARRRAATMSYDDAIAFIFGTLDRLTAEHEADPARSSST